MAHTCELRKSIENFNQSPKNLKHKIENLLFVKGKTTWSIPDKFAIIKSIINNTKYLWSSLILNTTILKSLPRKTPKFSFLTLTLTRKHCTLFLLLSSLFFPQLYSLSGVPLFFFFFCQFLESPTRIPFIKNPRRLVLLCEWNPAIVSPNQIVYGYAFVPFFLSCVASY